MIEAVQHSRVLYGVAEDKDYKVHRCKVVRLEYKEGKEMDCEIQLIGKRATKHVGNMVIFKTRSEANEYAAHKIFAQLMDEVECKVVDAKHYVIEDKEGRQWRPVKDTEEILCLSWDNVRCLTFSNIKGMAWCPADWTPHYVIGCDKLTYKWTAPENTD